MLSDEEKKAIERIDYIQDFIIENGQYNADVNDMQYFSKVLNIIEKQSKEIEELKEDKYGLEEEVQIQAKQLMLCENAIKETYTKWIDKIKAKIEEQDKIINTGGIDFNTKSYARCKKEFGQSLLEKE